MTKDQIIAMAREAGITFKPMIIDGDEYDYRHVSLRDSIGGDEAGCIELFAQLVAAQAAAEEREKANQDAKRYRFLRDNATPGIRPPEDEVPLNYMSIRLRVDTPVYSPSMWGKYVDDAIDSAILERK